MDDGLDEYVVPLITTPAMPVAAPRLKGSVSWNAASADIVLVVVSVGEEVVLIAGGRSDDEEEAVDREGDIGTGRQEDMDGDTDG